MELLQGNSNRNSNEIAIINSQTLQKHLIILSSCFEELQNQAIELFENNPAVDFFEMNQGFSSSLSLDFIAQPYKENYFEQIPTKLLSSHDKILAQEILQSLSEEGFLQKEEKAFLIQKHGQRILELIPLLQKHTELCFEDRIEFWIFLLKKKDPHSLLIEVLQRFHYEFLNGDFTKIIKHLKVTKHEFKNSYLNLLKNLPFSPKTSFISSPSNYKIDARITLLEESYQISIDSPVPRFSLNPMVHSQESDVKQFYKPYLEELNLFLEGIKKRSTTFHKVLKTLIQLQKSYLSGYEAFPRPLHPQDLSHQLNIHPSTLARCLQNKLILTPRGVIELKTLVTPQHLQTCKQDLFEKLKTLIKQENKKHPYTDGMLLKLLKEKGIHISRRTIVKYRKKLNIPEARDRLFLH